MFLYVTAVRDDLTLRCARDPRVSITFADRELRPDPRESVLTFAVTVEAPGLRARAGSVTHYVDGMAVARFVERLDLRGWDGELSWTSSDRDISVRAVYDGRGYMRLTWSLSPWRRSEQGEWIASVTLWLEGGSRDRFVADLLAFLSQGDHRGES